MVWLRIALTAMFCAVITGIGVMILSDEDKTPDWCRVVLGSAFVASILTMVTGFIGLIWTQP